MISEQKYLELIKRATPLNETEKNQVLAFENLIRLGNHYARYITSNDFFDLNSNYQQNMALLSLENNPSFNLQEALARYKKEQEKQQQIIKQEENSMKLTKRIESRAGFTNATIILFLVLLSGIILSVVLLSLS